MNTELKTNQTRKPAVWAAAALCAMLLSLLLLAMTAQAATKAVKVKTYRSSGSTERMAVVGYDGSGKAVWKFRTASYPTAQCAYTKCLLRGSRVYVFEKNKVTALAKATGRKLWVCKNITVAGQCAAIDSNQNVYVTGYMEDVVYKINAKGKIVWKKDVSATGNYWPYKVTYKNGKLTVDYDANISDPNCKKSHRVIFKASNGKILKYT